MASLFEKLQGKVADVLSVADNRLGLEGIKLTRTTWTEVGEPHEEPANPIPTDYPLKAYASGVSRQLVGQEFNGDMVLASDVSVIASAIGVPEDVNPVDFTITVDGREHRLIACLPTPRDAERRVSWRFIARAP